MKLNPVVGYRGGKRRLLTRLRPYFPADGIERYFEPFVGMGANYLDLRGRGYRGPAVLADSHPQVAAFWTMLHVDPDPLIVACERLGETEATTDRYYNILSERVNDPVELVARFLWLTNYAFGNSPNVYIDGWSRNNGTKLTSAAKWGKTFPWELCVERLRNAARVLAGTSTVVLDDAASALTMTTDNDHIYADPPYQGTWEYADLGTGDYIDMVNHARGFVVISERPDIAHRLVGWEREDGTMVARARMMSGKGAGKVRGEAIYVRSSLPEDEDEILWEDARE